VILYFDCEVKGPAPGALKRLGLYNYARHPDTDVLLVTWAIDDGPVQVWDRTIQRDMPRELYRAIWKDKARIVAHHAIFDRTVVEAKITEGIPIEQWCCTEAQALAAGFPGGLDKLSEIFKLGNEGKLDGDEYIKLFCEKGARPIDHPVSWMAFIEYAKRDITAMRALHKLLPARSQQEVDIWELDQVINDRGFQFDRALAEHMIEASNASRKLLDARITKLSGGAITAGTQRAKVHEYIKAGGLDIPDMKAETLNKALRDHATGVNVLDPDTLEMIEIRLLTARSSVAKCQVGLDLRGYDGRIRGSIKYHGGGRIGRFSHKGFQPGNMPRPQRSKEVVAEAISAILGGYAEAIWGEEAQSVCSDALRGLIIPALGCKLVVADYSNIEGRILAWYADEQWKLDAYRDRDEGVGEDLYKLLFHRMTGVPLDQIDDFLRQQGKGVDLSMGYEGGVGAFLNVANAYKLDLVKLAASAPKHLSAEQMARGQGSWEWAVANGETQGLPQNIYVACAALKFAYRDANPKIEQLWGDLLQCATLAVQHPGTKFECAGGKIRMVSSGRLLGVRLPSGRSIYLHEPKIETRVITTEVGEKFKTGLTARKAPHWMREGIYGGLLANLITQGLARDILCGAMLDVEQAGFPIIMHVHDEIVTELEFGSADHEELIRIMLLQAKRFPGLPLNAAGYTAMRYRKG
jgi:DNA polymerase